MNDTQAMRGWVGQHWRLFATAVIALIAAALIALVLLVIHQRNVDRSTREAVENSYVLRGHMQRVFSLMQDVETGARGFVITGKDLFLEPYARARSQLPGELNKLRVSAAADHEVGYVDRLDGLIRRKLAICEEMIAVRRNRSQVDATLLVQTGQGKRAMDDIRAVLGQWETLERRQLEVRLAAVNASSRELSLGLAALSLGIVALLVLTGAAAAELARSRDEAHAANQAKSAFLAMMSHELRTPLNGVLGMAHALEHTGLDDRQQAYLKVIDGSGRSLLAILNDILDLSKIEAGRLEIEHIPFHLTELLDAVVTLWRGPAAEKALDLTMDVDPDLPAWVSGDPTRLRQVLTNLLSNAIKFTDQGGVHLVVRRASAGKLRFTVADTGPGMSPAVQARLFTDFNQAAASTSRKYGGTGLGLSISRRLCRLMGGDLEVQSVEGVGATLYGSIEVGPASAPRDIPLEQEPGELPSLRILAVDDNGSNRAVIEALLHALGLGVSLASDGAEALDVLKVQPMDLVLMDINMPVMNGTEALRAIRRGEAGERTVRVVALTANAMTGDREHYLAQGFDDHLGKPIQPDALIEILMAAEKQMRVAA